MTVELPAGPFRCIAADPPWPYRTSSSGRFIVPKPQNEVDRGHRGVETMGYETMPMDEILALPVADVADTSAHIYLWTTNAFMREAFDVMDAWGFTYKTTLTWTKTQHVYPVQVSMKSGFYFRGATEHVLFGVRGSCPPPRTASHYLRGTCGPASSDTRRSPTSSIGTWPRR